MTEQSARHSVQQGGASGEECRFRAKERLHCSEDYQRVKRTARRFRTTHFGVNVAFNDVGYHRLGLVVQKRFFDAVRRNRIKRCLREWFRCHKQEIPPPGRDIVIIARSGAERLKTAEIALELFDAVISRLGTDRNG